VLRLPRCSRQISELICRFPASRLPCQVGSNAVHCQRRTAISYGCICARCCCDGVKAQRKGQLS
jgi:hypothetical protein